MPASVPTSGGRQERGGGLDDGGHGVVERGRHDVNFRQTVFLVYGFSTEKMRQI